MGAISRRRMHRRRQYKAHTQHRRRRGRKTIMKSVKSRRRPKGSAKAGTKSTKMRSGGIRMTKGAVGMMNAFVDGIYKKVSGEAERLRRKGRRPAIISSDMQSALKQILPRKQRRAAYSKTRQKETFCLLCGWKRRVWKEKRSRPA